MTCAWPQCETAVEQLLRDKAWHYKPMHRIIDCSDEHLLGVELCDDHYKFINTIIHFMLLTTQKGARRNYQGKNR